ncbi:MAG: ferredoxin [Candidatus Aenigmatarchaeota archaeon]|nr:MAG: ferredoxin [Candidatus Aenigmarchaeota archaeon]
MKIKIDGRRFSAKEGETILNVAKRNKIYIPTLCYHPDLKPQGRCRVCLVEVDGKLVTSCNTKVMDNMEIFTNTKRVKEARKLNIELIYNNHSGEKELEFSVVAKELGIKKSRFEKPKKEIKSPMERDNMKCLLCGRCVQVCGAIQSINNIEFTDRGISTRISTPYDISIKDSACTFCGQCALYCPGNAIRERAYNEKVVRSLMEEMNKIINKKKFIIAQTAPAVRASLGEMFGMKPGTLVTGKMVTALRKLGFDKVFDTDFGADLTIMEEANEFVGRMKEKKNLPLITSCCPAWIKFAEQTFPFLLKNISTCKSPHQMLGAIAKTYYAQKLKLKPKDLMIVSIMPCIAKKFEAQRPEMKISGCNDVDVVLTTREIGRIIKKEKINFTDLRDGEFDDPLGISSGGGAIFGVTGGVMEAALRVAYEILTGKRLKEIDFNQVRGFEGIREADIKIDNKIIKVGVVHGLGNIRKFIESDRWKKYHFIEMMACPGGCIGGGGQPRPTTNEIRKKRMEALYRQDKKMKIRMSNKNPAIKKLYLEFLGEPLGEMSKKLLHTKYKKRKVKYT